MTVHGHFQIRLVVRLRAANPIKSFKDAHVFRMPPGAVMGLVQCGIAAAADWIGGVLTIGHDDHDFLVVGHRIVPPLGKGFARGQGFPAPGDTGLNVR